MGSIFDLPFIVPAVFPRYISDSEKKQKDSESDKHFFTDSLPRGIKALSEKGLFAVDTNRHKTYTQYTVPFLSLFP